MPEKLTHLKIFDFMSDMSQEMLREKIPIVNNVIHEFPLEEKEEEHEIPDLSEEYYQYGDN